jgi:hypothetical protein
MSHLGVPTTFSATVTLKVPLGTSMGDIPLATEPPPADTTAPSTPARIRGQITTAAAGEAPAVADISLAALQRLGEENSAIVTVPVFRNSTPNVETSASSGSCPTGTDCVNYRLFVPASNPSVGIFRTSPPTSYAPPVSGALQYWVIAQAFVPMRAGAHLGDPDCVPPSFPAAFDATTQVSAKPGSATTQDFHFTGCRQ